MKAALIWLRSLWRRPAQRAGGFTSGLDEAIARHGWTGVYVGDYATAPTWTYSLGFTETLCQPEVIIFDVPEDSANMILSAVFDALRDGRLVLEDGKVWPEGEDHPFVWRRVDRSQLESDCGWFTFATMRSFLRTGMPFEFEAFQLVLSDHGGRMPWEDGYDEQLRALQPALYLPLQEVPSPLAAEPGV